MLFLLIPGSTIEQTHLLGAWVEAPGKNLTTIYLTHGHGNHFFM